MCWLVWAFRRAVSAQGLNEIKPSEFHKYREKVEVLFNWGHQLNNNGVNLAGNAQLCPAESGSVPLDFASWKRNVSWFDAVNYGPSLKDENGLGFLRLVRADVYALTDSGVRLAEALDEMLRSQQGYEILNSLDLNRASADVAQSLYKAWGRDEPSPREAEVFRHALYIPEAIGKQTRAGQRSSSIAVILGILKSASKPMDAHELRKVMAMVSVDNQDNSNSINPELNARVIWTVLQVRQAQRLAFEALFGWLEDRVLEHGETESAHLTESLMKALRAADAKVDEPGWLSEILARHVAVGEKYGSILIAGLTEPDVDIFEQMGMLQDAIYSSRDESAIRAVGTLLLVASITEELNSNENFRAPLSEGGSSRVSLSYWNKFVRHKHDLPAEAFLTSVIENFLLSQHFGVAALRTSENKPRLRLTIEEQGLMSLLKSTKSSWHPELTPDRLEAVMSLLADCGLVVRHRSEGGKALSYSAT